MSIGIISPKVKGLECDFDHLLPSSANVMTVLSYTSIPPHVSIA
jgi:hypothetical protein